MFIVAICIHFFILIYSVFSLLPPLFFFSSFFFPFLFPALLSLPQSQVNSSLCYALSLWSAATQFVEVVVWGRRHFGGLVVAMGFGGVGLGLPAWVSWVWVGRRGCGFTGMGCGGFGWLPWVGFGYWPDLSFEKRQGVVVLRLEKRKWSEREGGLRLVWERETKRRVSKK